MHGRYIHIYIMPKTNQQDFHFLVAKGYSRKLFPSISWRRSRVRELSNSAGWTDYGKPYIIFLPFSLVNITSKTFNMLISAYFLRIDFYYASTAVKHIRIRSYQCIFTWSKPLGHIFLFDESGSQNQTSLADRNHLRTPYHKYQIRKG